MGEVEENTDLQSVRFRFTDTFLLSLICLFLLQDSKMC